MICLGENLSHNRTAIVVLAIATLAFLAGCGGSGSERLSSETATGTLTPPSSSGPPSPVTGNRIDVASVAQLRSAVAAAMPGDSIVLSPGTYMISSQVSFNRPGTQAAPITLRAETAGQVTIQSSTVEMFNVSASDWRFENLTMEGVCASHSDCEHAFHIVGAAHRTVLRNNILRDYNAMVKGNGEAGTYPNDVLIENNRFYNRSGRNTSNPVTFIDVVGGGRWIVRGNFISDFYKMGGDQISYGAFLKGNSFDGLFEGNIVVCSHQVSGGTRIGLSLGGGGTGAAYCQFGTCATEHRNGTLRNNIVMNCSDVGIYLNRAQTTKIHNNTLYNTNGVDARFDTTTADVRNNILSSQVRGRDGGQFTSGNNLLGLSVAQMDAIFTNIPAFDFSLKNGTDVIGKGAVISTVKDDICSVARDAAPDLGAIEYAAGSTCVAKVKASF